MNSFPVSLIANADAAADVGSGADVGGGEKHDLPANAFEAALHALETVDVESQSPGVAETESASAETPVESNVFALFAIDPNTNFEANLSVELELPVEALANQIEVPIDIALHSDTQSVDGLDVGSNQIVPDKSTGASSTALNQPTIDDPTAIAELTKPATATDSQNELVATPVQETSNGSGTDLQKRYPTGSEELATTAPLNEVPQAKHEVASIESFESNVKLQNPASVAIEEQSVQASDDSAASNTIASIEPSSRTTVSEPAKPTATAAVDQPEIETVKSEESIDSSETTSSDQDFESQSDTAGDQRGAGDQQNASQNVQAETQQANPIQQHAENLNPTPQSDSFEQVLRLPVADSSADVQSIHNAPINATDQASIVDTGSARVENLPQTRVLSQAVASQVNEVFQAKFTSFTDEPRQSISLQLNPAELGQLQITVEQTSDQMIAQITATEFNATEMLLQEKDFLLETLSDLGYGEASLDISHGGSENDQQADEDQRHASNQRQAKEPSVKTSTNIHIQSNGVNFVA